MSTPMNVFVTETNVEIYLSRLHETWDAETRDTLLRLLAQEESQMGNSREHFENGERRVSEGRARVEKQRQMVNRLQDHELASHPAALFLQTLEMTQALLEKHLTLLRQRVEDKRL